MSDLQGAAEVSAVRPGFYQTGARPPRAWLFPSNGAALYRAPLGPGRLALLEALFVRGPGGAPGLGEGREDLFRPETASSTALQILDFLFWNILELLLTIRK